MKLCSGASCSRAIPENQRRCLECQAELTAMDGITLAPSCRVGRRHPEHSNEYDKSNKRSIHNQQAVARPPTPVYVQARGLSCKRCGTGPAQKLDHIVPATDRHCASQSERKIP